MGGSWRHRDCICFHDSDSHLNPATSVLLNSYTVVIRDTLFRCSVRFFFCLCTAVRRSDFVMNKRYSLTQLHAAKKFLLDSIATKNCIHRWIFVRCTPGILGPIIVLRRHFITSPFGLMVHIYFHAIGQCAIHCSDSNQRESTEK